MIPILNRLHLRLVGLVIAIVIIIIYGVISWTATRSEIRRTVYEYAHLQANGELRTIEHWSSALHALGNTLVLENKIDNSAVDAHIVLFQSAYPNLSIPLFVIQAQNNRLIGASPITGTAQEPYLRIANSICSNNHRWQATLGMPVPVKDPGASLHHTTLPACIRVRDPSGEAMLDIFALLPWPPRNELSDIPKAPAGQVPQLTLNWLGQSHLAQQDIQVGLGHARPQGNQTQAALLKVIRRHAENGLLETHGQIVAWTRVNQYPLIVMANVPVSTIWREWLMHGGAGEGFLLLLLFASALAFSAMRSSSLASEEAKLRRYYGALKDINHTLLKTPDPSRLYNMVCKELVEGADLPLAWIGTLKDKRVVVHAVAGEARGYVEGIELDLSEDSPTSKGPVAAALKSLQTVAVSDLQQYAGFAFWRGRAAQYGLRSLVITPFKTAGGEHGVLSAYALQTHFFTPALIQLMEELARDVTLGLNQYEHVREITRLSQQDSLTGLPNRDYFMRTLSQALYRADHAEKLTGIGILDLDYFKQINDNLGHLVGDQMLKHLAEQLGRAVRRGDTVARLGGDEFGILLEDLSGVDELESIADRLLESVRSPIQIQGLGHELRSDGSLGFTLYPLDEGTPDDLLRHADSALYAVKGTGRHRWQLYSRDMSQKAKREYLIHRRLPRAIDQHELRVFYQPQIDLADGSIAGAEALVRWSHSPRGLWLPASFIPTVEADTKLARQIGCFLLERTAEAITRWLNAGHPFKHLSVNICARHLQHSAFLNDLDAVLDLYPEAASRMTLELTETNALADIDKSAHTLGEVRMRGLGVALDDFGSGYASLQFVRELPLDTIKLDLQFVQNLERDTEAFAVGYAALTLAETHGATVVAEGVEDRRTAYLWRRLGGQVVQGFLFAKPMGERDWVKWLSNYQPDQHFASIPRWRPPLEILTLLQALPHHSQLVNQARNLMQKTHATVGSKAADVGEGQAAWLKPCPLTEWLKNTPRPTLFLDTLAATHKTLHDMANALLAHPETSLPHLNQLEASWKAFARALDQVVDQVDHELSEHAESPPTHHAGWSKPGSG